MSDYSPIIGMLVMFCFFGLVFLPPLMWGTDIELVDYYIMENGVICNSTEKPTAVLSTKKLNVYVNCTDGSKYVDAVNVQKISHIKHFDGWLE